jgi:hypothetical protein
LSELAVSKKHAQIAWLPEAHSFALRDAVISLVTFVAHESSSEWLLSCFIFFSSFISPFLDYLTSFSA